MERTKSETRNALPRSHFKEQTQVGTKGDARTATISSGHGANLCLASRFLHSSWRDFTDEETMTQKSLCSNSHNKQWKWDTEPTLLASEA